jgi:hypothetical protein
MHASACLCECEATAGGNMHAPCTSREQRPSAGRPCTLLATYMGMHVQLGGRVAPERAMSTSTIWRLTAMHGTPGALLPPAEAHRVCGPANTCLCAKYATSQPVVHQTRANTCHQTTDCWPRLCPHAKFVSEFGFQSFASFTAFAGQSALATGRATAAWSASGARVFA